MSINLICLGLKTSFQSCYIFFSFISCSNNSIICKMPNIQLVRMHKNNIYFKTYEKQASKSMV